MHYRIGEHRLLPAKDMVFINSGNQSWMLAKPQGFESRLEDIFSRPADARGSTKDIFRELFGVIKPTPRALDVDNTVYDG